LVCIRFKTTFNSYVSFQISVDEDEFPPINNTGVWLNRCLIAPFYGKLTSDQVYSFSSPVKPINAGAPPAADVMFPVAKQISSVSISMAHGGWRGGSVTIS
jgi:hypothetical protein